MSDISAPQTQPDVEAKSATPMQHLFDNVSLAIADRVRIEIPALCGQWIAPGYRKDPDQVDEYEADPQRRCASCRAAAGLPA